jgi:hypothetical protein
MEKMRCSIESMVLQLVHADGADNREYAGHAGVCEVAKG